MVMPRNGDVNTQSDPQDGSHNRHSKQPTLTRTSPNPPDNFKQYFFFYERQTSCFHSGGRKSWYPNPTPQKYVYFGLPGQALARMHARTHNRCVFRSYCESKLITQNTTRHTVATVSDTDVCTEPCHHRKFQQHVTSAFLMFAFRYELNDATERDVRTRRISVPAD